MSQSCLNRIYTPQHTQGAPELYTVLLCVRTNYHQTIETQKYEGRNLKVLVIGLSTHLLENIS